MCLDLCSDEPKNIAKKDGGVCGQGRRKVFGGTLQKGDKSKIRIAVKTKISNVKKRGMAGENPHFTEDVSVEEGSIGKELGSERESGVPRKLC